jgi:hypothetical protein
MSAELEFFDDVPGYKGLYQVSDKGRVISLERSVKKGKSRHSVQEKLIKPSPYSEGYLRVGLCKDGKTKCVSISRLVALTFLEPIAGKPTVDHINRDRTDNRFENLRWADSTEQNRNTSKFKQHISIIFRGSHKYPSKWCVSFRYENEKPKQKHFLTEFDANAFADSLDKTRIVPITQSK